MLRGVLEHPEPYRGHAPGYKYSIELFAVRVAASDNAPSSVAVIAPITSVFKVIVCPKSSSNMSYTSVTNVIVTDI